MDDLERRLERMLESQEIDESLLQEIMTLSPSDPAAARILARLQEAGADQGPSPMLNIEDYYRPGEGLYTLQWPLAPTTLAALPIPFDALDHKTQFFVLFQEWTRREFDATAALNAGGVDEARAIFEECLARADQLDVGELRARSYEGLYNVFGKSGDAGAAREALEAAMAARADAET